MGRVPIAAENRTGEGGDRFPKIKMTSKGEKRRFTVVEDPYREYVHYIKAPVFDQDSGKPVYENVKNKDGSSSERLKLDLISMPICLGDEGVLREKHLDVANCPGCDASAKSGGDIPPPGQRFSVNVIDYDLRGGGWELKKPFGADIKVWAFTGRQFDEIEAIQKQIGPLRNHDITLECEDPGWNRNKLSFWMEPGWREAPDGYIKELLGTEGNKATDSQLKDACGREVGRSRMQEDCDHALRLWRRLHNEGQEASLPGAASLDAGIDDLLGEEGGAGQPKVAAEAGAQAAGPAGDPFADGDPFSDLDSQGQSTLPSDAKSVAAGPAASKPASQGDFNFDDLLEGV